MTERLTGEQTAQAPYSRYGDWADLMRRITGDVKIVTKSPIKRMATPLIEVNKMPIPDELQGVFGQRAKVKVYGGQYGLQDMGYNVTIGTGPFGLRRHTFIVERPRDGDDDKPAQLTAAVRQRAPWLVQMGGLQPLPTVAPSLPVEELWPADVPPHPVTEPDEIRGYAALLEAVALTVQERGINHPRSLHLDRPTPLNIS